MASSSMPLTSARALPAAAATRRHAAPVSSLLWQRAHLVETFPGVEHARPLGRFVERIERQHAFDSLIRSGSSSIVCAGGSSRSVFGRIAHGAVGPDQQPFGDSGQFRCPLAQQPSAKQSLQPPPAEGSKSPTPHARRRRFVQAADGNLPLFLVVASSAP